MIAPGNDRMAAPTNGRKPRLSPRQAEVLKMVRQIYQVTREPVSPALISRRLDLSRSRVRNILADLQLKGHVSTDGPAQPAD